MHVLLVTLKNLFVRTEHDYITCMTWQFPVKNQLRDNMSLTMHGTSISLNPVYISLYFPTSSNRDISMLFLALSYSYSEQCWSYINNAYPFWYDGVSLQLLPFVITPPLPKIGKHNWFLARSDDGKRLMIIRTHEPEKLYWKNPLYTSTVKYVSIRTVVVMSMSRIPAWWGLQDFLVGGG